MRREVAIIWDSFGWLAKVGGRVLDPREIEPRLESERWSFTYACAAAVLASKFPESFNR